MVNKAEWIWFDGQFRPWDDVMVHVGTHSLHYGVAAFEGIRCYAQTAGGAAIFRLREHLQRLFDSAKIALLDVPFSLETLSEACIELVRKNNLTDGCYLRPLVFMGSGAMGLSASDNPIHVVIMAWRWGAYLGEEGVQHGIRAQVSSYRRPQADAMMSKGKITGQYVTSILAKREALRAGFQEAILLDTQGLVCEGSGENIFVVHHGEVLTPPLGAAILAGITRGTVLRLLEADGYTVRRSRFGRDVLYCADEIFVTGTAAEVTPVREVDTRAIGTGKPGPVTLRVQERYAALVRGEIPEFGQFLTPV